MLSPKQALERTLDLLTPLPGEWASIQQGLGRALAQDIQAQRTLPPWDNSAMDGYAVLSADLTRVPVQLRVIETVHAGEVPRRSISPGECARIMTGAPLPDGADAVVMQEKTRRLEQSDGIEILEQVGPGTFVRSRGEDAREGECLLRRGTALGIPEAALLWAQGCAQVYVPRRPRATLFSTGDELCRVDEPPNGRIVDTNSLSIAAAIERAGGTPTSLGIARDSLDEVLGKLQEASSADLVIINAGASVGERDFARQALEELGVQISFWRVAIKPGKPLAVGRRGSTVYFAMPGNPTSSLVCFELFVRPAIRRLLGHQEVTPLPSGGRLEVPLEKRPGLTHYVRVVARWRDGNLWATPLATQTSGALRSAAQATHLLVFPADESHLPVGATVELLPVSWAT